MLGEGIIKGLAETARNFVGSYVDEERLTTVQYPEERLPAKEAARNFPFLVFDGEDPHAGLRCVACQICEKECPPQCIYIEKSNDKKPDYVGKAQFYPAVFDIDVSVCMSCQICVEVCPFDAISEAAEVEAHLAAEKAKAEAKVKADAEAKARAAAVKAAAASTPKPAPVPTA